MQINKLAFAPLSPLAMSSSETNTAVKILLKLNGKSYIFIHISVLHVPNKYHRWGCDGLLLPEEKTIRGNI